jgi:universal stress protein A
MQIKTILVPCDFSAHAEYAFRWALELAERRRAKVVLFHVVPVLTGVSYQEEMLVLASPALQAEHIAEAEKHLHELVVKHEVSTVTVVVRATMDHPVWGICQAAEREHADLIVMGSHGRTGIAHVLLGSVAERVVRHSPCPVLVTRLPQTQEG